MKRGEIPGFYYDEDKQKYFKIEANHIAPPSAKYAQSQVSRELQIKKKNNRELGRLRARHNQTVTRSQLLNHPILADIGLTREHGRGNVTDAFHRWRAFEYSHAQLKTTSVSPYASTVELLDVVQFRAPQMTLAALLHNGDVASAELNRRFLDSDCDDTPASWIRVAAFNSPIVSVSTNKAPPNPYVDCQRMLICAQKASIPGNVHFCGISADPSHNTNGFYLKLGSASSSLWASSMQNQTNYSAICGDKDVFILGELGEVASHRELPGESRDVAWLDTHTLCLGQHGRQAARGVMLWDVRSQGSSLRFGHNWPTTGIRTLEDGIRILAAENRQVRLYDLRSHKHPLLSFSHTHHGPKLQFDLLSQDLFAAVDIDNVVQMYSIKPERTAATVLRHQTESQKHIVSLRSLDDLRFQACQGTSLLTWSASTDD